MLHITDAQLHIWGADSPQRPWPPLIPGESRPHRDQPITKDELLENMSAAGVARAVLVPPAWEGIYNDLALAAALAHPDRFAVMGRIDAETPAPSGTISRWLEQPGMLGLRFTFNRPRTRPPFAEGRLEWLWDEAEQGRVPIALLIAQADMNILDGIAQRHPALPLIIDHLGLTHGKDKAAFRDLDKLLAIARHANVAVKVSSLPLYTDDDYPYRALHPYLRRIYDAFGPERMFWGSDFSRQPCSYRQAITMYTEEIPWLNSRDLELIMGVALSRWLNWPPPR